MAPRSVPTRENIASPDGAANRRIERRFLPSVVCVEEKPCPTYHKNETVCRVRQTKFDTSAASARSNEPEIDPENDHPLEFVKTSASSTPPLTTARDRTTVPSRLPRKRIMGCCGPKECVEGTSDAFSFPSHASRARSPGQAVSASPSKSGNNGNRASSRRARRGVRRDTFFGSRRSRRNRRSR